MRVVAGAARGIPLSPPPLSVRPTMDRVKEAVFSSLGDAVPGARVLDLFAGSGAMGIEALSRGAEEAVFVDSGAGSISCLRENLRRTRLTGPVQQMDALKFIELYAQDGFDLIFADPPYAKKPGERDFAAELLQSPGLRTALRPHGTLILECLAGRLPAQSPHLTLLKARRYGKSEIGFYIHPKEQDLL